ncbi:MAG: efflux RND transporter periplasmic adaptor subunit [Methylococcaceae bacterium]|nr:efflux RND transporter periplasmic adaptor subunit [Methylococcaceae bacterium]
MKINRLGLLLLSLITGCDKPQPSAPLPRPALVMVVGNQATAHAMSLVGEVRPRYESGQGFRINGKIIARKAEVGDRVKKGQIIVKLDPSDTNLNVASAQANVTAAEASLNLAAAELTRYQKLFAKHFISASALDIKKAELKTAKARLDQEKANAEVAGNQTEYTNLIADRDGILTQIRAEPGQVVEAGEVIAQIADTKLLEVLVAVPESKMAEVSLNIPVNIKLWASPEKIYAGKVREIAPSADSSTRAFNVRVTLQDADDAVKLSMTARVRFNSAATSTENNFLIPNSAVTELNGKPSVWVIDADNKAQPREVVAGGFTENGVSVISGLQAGEKIATVGVHTLVKNQAVKPVIEATP